MARTLNPSELPVALLPYAQPPHGLVIDSHEYHTGFREALTNKQPVRRFDLHASANEEAWKIVRNLCYLYHGR